MFVYRLSVRSGGKSYRLVLALFAGLRDGLGGDAGGLAWENPFPACSPTWELLAGERPSYPPSQAGRTRSSPLLAPSLFATPICVLVIEWAEAGRLILPSHTHGFI